MNFSALALGSKARNCPNLYFNPSVKLFIPHVPDSLNWCSNCFILEMQGTKKRSKHEYKNRFVLTKISYASASLQLAGYLYSQFFLSTVQTSILSYKDHSTTAARQLASLVNNKVHKNGARIVHFYG